MRRLRVLTVVPLVAGLLFAGAATTAAQSGAPVIPGVPSMNLPYVDAGFPCEWPRETLRPALTTASDNIGATDESFVFLMSQATSSLPSLPGAVMGQGMDFNFMKCFFHYHHGVEGPSRMEQGFYCAYNSQPNSPISSGRPFFRHIFEHSKLIVRDEFAILLCWGTDEEE